MRAQAKDAAPAAKKAAGGGREDEEPCIDMLDLRVGRIVKVRGEEARAAPRAAWAAWAEGSGAVA
jgi:hypothetical protein